MKENNLGPENISFKDENIFPLHPYMNRGINKIRISKKTEKKLKFGDEKATELVTRRFHQLMMVLWFLTEYVIKDWGKLYFIAKTLIVLLINKY